MGQSVLLFAEIHRLWDHTLTLYPGVQGLHKSAADHRYTSTFFPEEGLAFTVVFQDHP